MELTVVTPTFNEAENVERFVRTVSGVLRGIQHQIVIADDDSPDQTWRVAQELAKSFASVRVLRRQGRRSLAGSVIDGFSMAAGDVVACIDADLQHDPAILPAMLGELRGGAELVVGCRYMPGGGTTNWNWIRRLESWTATRMAQAYLGLKLRDPMSGYFMLRRQDFMAVRHQLSAQGFKVLVEIAARLQPQPIAEVPYVFGPRLAGVSKLTARVALDYVAQLRRLRATASPARARAPQSAI
jgi:dolichol-phosphate mannosyltransferase